MLIRRSSWGAVGVMALPRRSRKCKNKPTIRHRRIMVLRLGEGPRMARVKFPSRKNKPTLCPELLGFYGGRWYSTTGRGARSAPISPAWFSRRSHRENRAGQLLSQKKASEATRGSAKTKPFCHPRPFAACRATARDAPRQLPNEAK